MGSAGYNRTDVHDTLVRLVSGDGPIGCGRQRLGARFRTGRLGQPGNHTKFFTSRHRKRLSGELMGNTLVRAHSEPQLAQASRRPSLPGTPRHMGQGGEQQSTHTYILVARRASAARRNTAGRHRPQWGRTHKRVDPSRLGGLACGNPLRISRRLSARPVYKTAATRFARPYDTRLVALQPPPELLRRGYRLVGRRHGRNQSGTVVGYTWHARYNIPDYESFRHPPARKALRRQRRVPAIRQAHTGTRTISKALNPTTRRPRIPS